MSSTLSARLSGLRLALSAMRAGDELPADTLLEVFSVEIQLLGAVQEAKALEDKLQKLQEWESCYDDT